MIPIYYIRLIIGIITSPSEAFDRIIKYNHIRLAIGLWLFSTMLSLLFTPISQHLNVTTIIFMFSPFWLVAIQDLLADKYFKLKSNYRALLTCTLFLSILGILRLFLTLIGHVFIPSFDDGNLLIMIFIGFWALALNIMAIRKVYDTTQGRAIIIYLTPIIGMSFLIMTI
ncbi:MAG: YIP1 family protein [Planctomycetes bacterium]|nr:YIP1 family protein [Planctomycetota bacterium]